MNNLKVNYYFDKEIILIKNKYHRDNRGSFSELYNYNNFKKIGIKIKFVQDNISFSKKKYTIRGLHIQTSPMSQYKLIKVNKGSIFDVVLDLRKSSKSYGKYKSFILKENDGKLLFVSDKFAHGFCTLKNNTEVFYKVNNYYSKKHYKSILWKDKDLQINWPLKNIDPILSVQDKKGLSLKDFKFNLL